MRLLSGLGPDKPPSAVARALGREIRFLALPGGLRGYTVSGRKKLLISPSGYRAADEFSIAHELIESFLPDRLEKDHEQFCERAAASLALPANAFIGSVARNVFDVPALRREWPWASYEAIIWRMAELLPGVVATKWLNSEVVRRRARNHVRETSPAEVAALRVCFRRGRGMAFADDELALAWRLAGRGERFRAVSLAFPA